MRLPCSEKQTNGRRANSLSVCSYELIFPGCFPGETTDYGEWDGKYLNLIELLNRNSALTQVRRCNREQPTAAGALRPRRSRMMCGFPATTAAIARFDVFKACSWIAVRKSAKTLRQLGSTARAHRSRIRSSSRRLGVVCIAIRTIDANRLT